MSAVMHADDPRRAAEVYAGLMASRSRIAGRRDSRLSDTVTIQRPTPREAWQALLAADQAVFSAGPDEALELAARQAREVFNDALRRAR